MSYTARQALYLGSDAGEAVSQALAVLVLGVLKQSEEQQLVSGIPPYIESNVLWGLGSLEERRSANGADDIAGSLVL